MAELRFDFSEGIRDAESLNRHAQLPDDLRHGKNAAQPNDVLPTLINHQNMLPSGLLERGDNMPELGGSHLFEIQHLKRCARQRKELAHV